MPQSFCRRIPIFIFILLLFASCGIIKRGTPPETEAGPGTPEDRVIEAGLASWYGPDFHGRRTANGETYNMNDLTAAHKTLPFNTVVQVENRDNGKSVIVRINDRGPYVANRVIDLSRRAAQQIDMIGPGTADVNLRLVQEGDRPLSAENTSSAETFTVQIASFMSRNEAEDTANRTEGARVEDVTISGGRTVYRVYFGIYGSSEDARRAQEELARKNINGFVKQIEN